MPEKKFDVIIVGAGPAGAATAISLKDSGLTVAVMDKGTFPRDKICGDALSLDVVNQLEILSPSLSQQFQNLKPKKPSYGVKIFSPDRTCLEIPFLYKQQTACGYACQRLDFDNLLVDQLRNVESIQLMEGCELTSVQNVSDTICIQTNRGSFFADMVVGCDGAQSIVAKSLQNLKPDKTHYSAGLRVYYEGITSFHPENFIELHFFRKVLPGYLWIFPLPGGKANVGIGMPSSLISKRKINLREMLHNLLITDPQLKQRFENARALETVKGFGLPLGSKLRALSGERFLLAGDAASLIDPFTGEGIANAIRSGRVAALHILKSFQQRNFSHSFNLKYDQEIYRRMWKEMQFSKGVQNVCRFPFIFNLIARKVNRNPHAHQFLVESLGNVEKNKSFFQPGFYYRMLFQ